MEPKIISKPAFTLVGMKYHGQNKHNEIPRLWDKFMRHTAEIAGVVNRDRCYGACGPMDAETGAFDYLAACEVAGETAVPANMERWKIPANAYAVFTCTLPTIHVTFDHIYGQWLPQSPYKRAPGPEFELYDETFDPNDPHSPLYLYIPVQKA